MNFVPHDIARKAWKKILEEREKEQEEKDRELLEKYYGKQD